MTEKANPSINRPAEAFKTAGAIALGGGNSEGWIVDGASPTEISVQDAGITEADLGAFAEVSRSGLDVTLDGGEAFVYGSWLAIDTDTTVSLADNTSNQTVYAGWNKGGSNDVIVGLDSAFSNATGDTDKKIPLFDFATSSGSITGKTDRRTIGKTLDGRWERNYSSVSSNYTTDGEQLLFVDTSGSAVTVTLSTADLDDGSEVIVVDSGGNAKSNNITVDTQGSANINGSSSTTVESEYGAVALASDGSNWFTSGAGGAGGLPVEDDGTIVLDPAGNINFASGNKVSDDNDGSVTVDIEPADFAGTALQDDGSDNMEVGGPLTSIDFKTSGDVLQWQTDGNNDLILQNTTDATTLLTLDQDNGDILSSNVVPNAALDNSSVTVTAGTALTGGGTVSLGGSTTLNVDPADDEEIQYGTGDDISVRFDATNDELRWEDTGTSDRMALDRSTGDLTLEGTLTEGATL